MARVAIFYQSKYGQTAKIVQRIRKVLESSGAHVTTYNTDVEQSAIKHSQYDFAIVGGPVFAGHMPKHLVQWSNANVAELNQLGCAVFSVSLNAADARPEARREDLRIINGFLESTGLKPSLSASLKGALPYTRYGWFIRFIMRRISEAAGGPTDTSRDYEMTDWNEVEQFARECLAVIDKPRISAAA